MSSRWWRNFASVAKISLVHVDLSRRVNFDEEAVGWLDDSELERSKRFVSTEARRRFELCRAALRANLCSSQGCSNSELSFSSVRLEKPTAYVNGVPIVGDFSVSHSFDNGLIAFSEEGKVGTDIEDRKLRHDIDGPIRDVFSASEQQALNDADPETRVAMFFRLWTFKEAIIKATGEGFRAKTSSFSIPESLIQGGYKSELVYPPRSNQRWLLVNLENDDFAAAFVREIPC